MLVRNPNGAVVGARLVPYTAPVGSLDSTDAGASVSQVDVCLKAPGHPSLAHQLGRALLPPVGKWKSLCLQRSPGS